MRWDEKPYYSLNYFLREKFGSKVGKLSLDAGFTCPNRDGKISTGGCMFCSERGSGDFAPVSVKTITEQINEGKINMSNKWNISQYIAYFQAYTNTYAKADVLREKYFEAMACKDIAGLAVATRPDCFDWEILDLLDEINKKTCLWVELGFQTSNEKTAKLINRGYNNSVFEGAVHELTKRNIDVVAHIIMGLPLEDKTDILNTIKYVSAFPISGIKLHLLHILKKTPLEEFYNKNPFYIMSKEEYVSLICECIKFIPENIVIHRLTGDGPRKTLIEPKWSLEKSEILNSIHRYLKENKIYQGQNC